MKSDAIFKRRFGIQTPITYLWDVRVQKNARKEFTLAWKKFYCRAKPLTSPTRHKRLVSLLQRVWKEQSDERYCQRVAIKYIGEKIGFGVFALENIPPYSSLIHYAGIIRPERSIGANNDSTFAFTKFKPFSIDAMHYGNWARFINHGEEGRPGTNVIAWEIYLPDAPRIVFTAGAKGIKKGEQLLYSYGKEYWQEKAFELF